MKFDFTINVPILIAVAVALVKIYTDIRETRIKVNAMWSVFMRQYGTRASDKIGQHKPRKIQ